MRITLDREVRCCSCDEMFSQSNLVCQQCGVAFGTCECVVNYPSCQPCLQRCGTTQNAIERQLHRWLNEGWDLGAMLGRVQTMRIGQAQVAARNAEFRRSG